MRSYTRSLRSSMFFPYLFFPYLFSAYLFIENTIFPSSCFAGGLELSEFGSPGLGVAGAGEVARAQDASTVFTNPAGLSRIKGGEVLLGAQALFGDAHFEVSDVSTTSGEASGNPIGFFPGGSFFYANEINEDWTFGFGNFSYFGMPLDFNNDWSGRYYTQDNSLLGMSFLPSLSYEVSDALSIGFGLNAMFGMVAQQAALPTIGSVIGGSEFDGKFDYKDSDWGFGANLGALYELSEGTRFGIRYTSALDFNFSDTPEFTDIGPLASRITNAGSAIDLGMQVPHMISFGFFHDLSDSLAILASTGWQDWSKFGRVDVGLNRAGTEMVTIDMNTQDTWNLGAGLQYKACESWLLSAGINYDSSMFDDVDRPVTIPVGSLWRYGLGAQYMVSEDLTLGAAYELSYAGDLPVDQERGPLAGRLAGSYEDSIIHYWALNMQWKFGQES